jgi:CheY-like chemotaxis protein
MPAVPVPITFVALDMKVLVIDDDASVRVGMRQLLLQWGCTCVVVESIEDAVVASRKSRPDLVISDYRLREQRRGTEAIALLRAEFGDDLPALLITGDTAPGRLRDAQASGIALLHKPVSPEQLYRMLWNVRH